MKRISALFIFLILGCPAFADPPAVPKPVEATASLAGPIRTRIAADRFLRRLQREGKLTADQSAAVAKLRAHPDAMDDFVAGLPAVKGASQALAGSDRPILDWLAGVGKWFWDNREAILAFILELMKLFAFDELGFTGPLLC